MNKVLIGLTGVLAACAALAQEPTPVTVAHTSPGDAGAYTQTLKTGEFRVVASEATDGVLSVWADNGDDAADKWTITALAAGGLTIANGAVGTVLTISAAGVVDTDVVTTTTTTTTAAPTTTTVTTTTTTTTTAG